MIHQESDVQKHSGARASAYGTDNEYAGLCAVDNIGKFTADFRVVQRMHCPFNMRGDIAATPEIGDMADQPPHAGAVATENAGRSSGSQRNWFRLRNCITLAEVMTGLPRCRNSWFSRNGSELSVR